MGYILAKNLKVNKNTGVISGEFASSNVWGANDRHIYTYGEDIYQDEDGGRTPILKYAYFILDIVSGMLQGNLGKYKHICIPQYYEEIYKRDKNTTADEAVIKTYLKYKDLIEKQLKTSYIIKIDGQFLISFTKKYIKYGMFKEKAKKFYASTLSNITKTLDINNIDYEVIEL